MSTTRFRTSRGDFATPEPSGATCVRCRRAFYVDSSGDMAEQEVGLTGSGIVHMRCKRPKDVVDWDMHEENEGLPLDLRANTVGEI